MIKLRRSYWSDVTSLFWNSFLISSHLNPYIDTSLKQNQLLDCHFNFFDNRIFNFCYSNDNTFFSRLKAEALLLRLDSDKNHGRFGRAIRASQNHLFVGAPRYTVLCFVSKNHSQKVSIIILQIY